YGLGGVLSSLPVLWVNHPARAAAASKPVQLTTAASCGLTVPDILITNEPAALCRFTQAGETVAKMLGATTSPKRAPERSHSLACSVKMISPTYVASTSPATLRSGGFGNSTMLG
ncbi:MAG: hypothetical protein ACRDSN_17065, partial [Pseudonocardiaceae bacterium]